MDFIYKLAHSSSGNTEYQVHTQKLNQLKSFPLKKNVSPKSRKCCYLFKTSLKKKQQSKKSLTHVYTMLYT